MREGARDALHRGWALSLYNGRVIALLVTLLLVVPPLTEAQRELAQQTTDRAGFDEAGLYALLSNVMTWEAGDEAGARVPDYAALYADPAAHRGEVFLLEGDYAGRSRRVGLANPGDYGEQVTEWVLVTDRARDAVAVVFFVDPDGALREPRLGHGVRAAARFYKVWSDRDAHGTPTDYLLFVAKSPTPARAAGGAAGSGQTSPAVLLALVLAAALGVFVLRRRIVKPIAPRRVASSRAAADVAAELESHLPVDPAEALDELRRHGQ